jgi:hypothetical protein
MSAPQAALRLARCLEDEAVEYAIGGALALGIWGAPRATADVDISIFASKDHFGPVAQALERAGVIFDREAAPKELDRIGMFYGRLGRTKIDVFMSAHPHMAAMKTRRRVALLEGTNAWFISAEDLCVMKLIYGRGKDIADLERLLAARPDLDTDYVRGWLVQMVPAGDRRLAALDDLERRFVTKT